MNDVYSLKFSIYKMTVFLPKALEQSVEIFNMHVPCLVGVVIFHFEPYSKCSLSQAVKF